MADPATGAIILGGVGALGSIGSAAITARGQRKSDERTNQAAIEQQRRAERQNIRFWNMQNEFNHPSSQMARLREAGLNPNLVYGQNVAGATGHADKIDPSKAAPQSYQNQYSRIGDSFHFMNQFADMSMKRAQTDNLHEQNTVLQQEAALKGAQTADTAAKTARTKFDLNLAEELRQTSVDASKQALKKLEQDTIGRELENTYQDKALASRLKKIYYEAAYAREQMSGQQLLNKLRQLEVDLNKLGVTKNDHPIWRILSRGINEMQRTPSIWQMLQP